jgi:hypothetical protein
MTLILLKKRRHDKPITNAQVTLSGLLTIRKSFIKTCGILHYDCYHLYFDDDKKRLGISFSSVRDDDTFNTRDNKSTIALAIKKILKLNNITLKDGICNPVFENGRLFFECEIHGEVNS